MRRNARPRRRRAAGLASQGLRLSTSATSLSRNARLLWTHGEPYLAGDAFAFCYGRWCYCNRGGGCGFTNTGERGALRSLFQSAWHDQADDDPSENSDDDIGHERKWQEDTPAQIAPRRRCRKRPQALAVKERLFKNIEKCSHEYPLARAAFAACLREPIHWVDLQQAAERRQGKKVAPSTICFDPSKPLAPNEVLALRHGSHRRTRTWHCACSPIGSRDPPRKVFPMAPKPSQHETEVSRWDLWQRELAPFAHWSHPRFGLFLLIVFAGNVVVATLVWLLVGLFMR
jgi:hypothetical protein